MSSRCFRLTLGTRILLVLIGVATASNVIAVVLQFGALSTGLRRTARADLQRAASIASQLVDERLVAQAGRYGQVLSTPQFVAEVEVGGTLTLNRRAQQLQCLYQGAAVLFLSDAGEELGGAGDEGLRRAVREHAACATGMNSLLLMPEAPLAVVRLPIPVVTRRPLQLVVAETLGSTEFLAWSKACRATISYGENVGDTDLTAGFRAVGTRQLRVTALTDVASAAIAHSWDSLIAGGTLGLALAFAASIFLARSLVRPIRTIQTAAERIGAGMLAVRLDESRNDEVGDVARSFNQMLDSLQRNVVERARVENRITHLAFHDSLTGLPNRRLLKEQLAVALAHARLRRSHVAVVFLDVDRFKHVNDSLGHSAGDTLLLSVACRLHTCIEDLVANPDGTPKPEGQAAFLARLGGDEFTLIVPDARSRAHVTAIAERILATFVAPCEVRGHEVAVSASLGIAMAPTDGQDVETLLRHSDMAMYAAKARGGAGYEFYADSMEEISARRLALENKLHRALENDEFELHYQPKVDIETGAVTGMEALLRWRSNEAGLASPGDLVQMAEETGAIVALGDWVLREAIAQNVAWQRQGLPPVRMAVNVSPRQLEQRDDFVTKVSDLLIDAGLEPSLLELEVTEYSMLKHEEAAVALFERVRQLGVGLSLDDFGTGYSSLSYLRRLPIDTLKIDRAFIHAADESQADVALIGAIIAMAKVLDLRVIVEGVETDSQLSLLEQLGCDEYQGYLFSPAICAEKAAEILRTQGAAVGALALS